MYWRLGEVPRCWLRRTLSDTDAVAPAPRPIDVAGTEGDGDVRGDCAAAATVVLADIIDDAVAVLAAL
jgi:hypothetical protein